MTIKLRGEIVINTPIANTFGFVANLENDCLWRAEINQTIIDGPVGLGVTATEYSRLSARKPDNLITLECVEFNPLERVMFRSVKNARFYVESTREVQKMSPNATNVVYTIEFDAAIVKVALGFALPNFLIDMKAKRDMNKYLAKLKSVLESTDFDIKNTSAHSKTEFLYNPINK